MSVMPTPALILHVRFRSRLALDEVVRVMEERAPEFAALDGLLQKYYLQDTVTGEYAGIYLWESHEAFTAYRESELRTTIAAAYQAEGEPRIQVYRVIRPLRP